MSLFTPAELRKYPTLAEKIMWKYLQARQCLGFKFRRQHQIDRTIVDFVCIREKLVIELDGSIHNKRKEYDQRRDAWLRSQGYRVMRFKNEEVEKTPENVLEEIKLALRHLNSD
jgi:very-short-patch-repair endonuclease